ncbi:transcription initiation protein SPT3 homolog isoform X2 [Mya arenaria]|uniref:transcription initiation protein SPT3 homolog isoform X2 n=1 Tax=Mya arenaria TaxID=6604 RepID=UPI0022E526F8|nr:transcription initiation protein SPT3 homolog isoform X2 [Mya arenaria]
MGSKEPQSSPQIGGKSSAQHWFVSDIQLMMHGMGDCDQPLLESAALVEEITQHQMISVLYQAADVSAMRGSKLLGVEDFLFLMRKDKVKLRRLLRYMNLRDLKATFNRATSVEEENGTETASDLKPVCGKRVKICHDFLSSIDQTGELVALFDDEEEDDVKYERLLRADMSSRCMDPAQYMEFAEARSVNFSRKHKTQKFREWLFTGLDVDIKPTQTAVEVVSYLAYETVAQIVDLALLVKQDSQTGYRDPVSQTLPSILYTGNQPATPSPLIPKPDLTSPTGSGPGGVMEVPMSQAIQPAEIQEAMRRYSRFIGPFASEMKFNSTLSPKFLNLCV